eukprot:427827-Ditylum_brightwellii.AAC.1
MGEDVAISLSNLKLASQEIVEFSGRIEEWQKWKNITPCTLAHKKEKDWYEAWQSLLEWYDGNEASHYISNFLTSYQETDNIPNEGWSESHALNVFFKGITDPSYEMFVRIQRSKNESLNDAVLALRKHEGKLNEKHIKKRKFKNTIQRMIDSKEITFDWDDDERSSSPMKKARRTKNRGLGTLEGDVQGHIIKCGFLKVMVSNFWKLSDGD